MPDSGWLTSLRNIIESYDSPALLIDQHYTIVLANSHYRKRFSEPEADALGKCYSLSHGYTRPCDQEGETCPLQTCSSSGVTAQVLHVHNTPRGKEHVSIETTPVFDEQQRPYFIEVVKPVLEASAEPSAERMIGRSAAFNRMVDLIHRAGPTDVSVLLMGASGTGKELAAKALHEASARALKPFVTVECSGLTDSLFESELFGHVKGAFTGASHARMGLVESCQGGTLFLDEVGDIPLHLQVKLLRLIETGTFRPVGSNQSRIADFRLVCATHKDLPALVEQGDFREDLFHRIGTFPIPLPSLADRLDDLPLLVSSLLLVIAPSEALSLTPEALALLSTHPFRGNIRELKNILHRAVVLRQQNRMDESVIQQALDLLPVKTDERGGTRLEDLAREGVDLIELERRYLSVLQRVFPDKASLAKHLGCSLRTLYRKLDR